MDLTLGALGVLFRASSFNPLVVCHSVARYFTLRLYYTPLAHISHSDLSIICNLTFTVFYILHSVLYN